MVASLRAQSALATLPVSLGSSYRPALRWSGIPGLRSASRCSSIQHGRPTPSHRPALTLARCSGAADALWACSTIRYGRSASLASSLAALPTSLGLLRAASPTGRALRAPLAPPAALRPSIAHCARPPCAPRPSTPSGLRRLRPVSRIARGLRAPPLHKGGSGVVLLPAAYH